MRPSWHTPAPEPLARLRSPSCCATASTEGAGSRCAGCWNARPCRPTCSQARAGSAAKDRRSLGACYRLSARLPGGDARSAVGRDRDRRPASETSALAAAAVDVSGRTNPAALPAQLALARVRRGRRDWPADRRLLLRGVRPADAGGSWPMAHRIETPEGKIVFEPMPRTQSRVCCAATADAAGACG